MSIESFKSSTDLPTCEGNLAEQYVNVWNFNNVNMM